jgi:hypothetical protein
MGVGVGAGSIGAAVSIGLVAIGGIVRVLSTAAVEASSTDRVGGENGVLPINVGVNTSED